MRDQMADVFRMEMFIQDVSHRLDSLERRFVVLSDQQEQMSADLQDVRHQLSRVMCANEMNFQDAAVGHMSSAVQAASVERGSKSISRAGLEIGSVAAGSKVALDFAALALRQVMACVSVEGALFSNASTTAAHLHEAQNCFARPASVVNIAAAYDAVRKARCALGSRMHCAGPKLKDTQRIIREVLVLHRRGVEPAQFENDMAAAFGGTLDTELKSQIFLAYHTIVRLGSDRERFEVAVAKIFNRDVNAQQRADLFALYAAQSGPATALGVPLSGRQLDVGQAARGDADAAPFCRNRRHKKRAASTRSPSPGYTWRCASPSNGSTGVQDTAGILPTAIATTPCATSVFSSGFTSLAGAYHVSTETCAIGAPLCCAHCGALGVYGMWDVQGSWWCSRCYSLEM